MICISAMQGLKHGHRFGENKYHPAAPEGSFSTSPYPIIFQSPQGRNLGRFPPFSVCCCSIPAFGPAQVCRVSAGGVFLEAADSIGSVELAARLSVQIYSQCYVFLKLGCKFRHLKLLLAFFQVTEFHFSFHSSISNHLLPFSRSSLVKLL